MLSLALAIYDEYLLVSVYIRRNIFTNGIVKYIEDIQVFSVNTVFISMPRDENNPVFI